MDAVGRPRLTPLALAAVSAAAALSLGRIYDRDYLLPTLLAALLPHLIGELLRRRPLPVLLEAVIPVAALGVFLVWATPRNHTIFGVPTPESIRSLAHALADGAHSLRVDTPPIAGHGGALLIGLACVWLVAQVADALAFRAHAPYGAVIPSLALVIVCAALTRDGQGRAPTVVYALAVVVFLATITVAGIHRRRAPFGDPDPHAGRTLALSGIALGVVAVVVAGLVAPHLPGADAAPLIDYRGLGGPKGPTDVSLASPVADVTAQLRDQPNTVVFTAQTDDDVARYWRMAALRQFENDRWEPDGTTVLANGRLDDADLSRYERRTLNAAPTGQLQQLVEILALSTKYLPAAYRPVDFRGRALTPEQEPRVIVETDTLVATENVGPGDSYRVTSAVPVSLTADEQADLAARPAETMPQSFVTTYTQLPSDVSPDVEKLANRIVNEAGAETPYAQASALQEYFSPGNGFVYDLRPNLTDDGESANAMDAFLFSDDPTVRGHGYCVQFATAFTELARSLGIPTRFAVGFTSGELTEGSWTVRGRNAHAWPEVWIPGLGWSPFEPTPGPENAPFVNPDNPSNAVDVTPPTAVQNPPPPTATPTPSPAPIPSTPTSTKPPSGDASGSAWPLVLVLAPLLVLAVLAAVVALLLAPRRRRRLRRRGGDPRHATLGAWAEALEQLAAAGLPSRAVQTPTEYAADMPDAELGEPMQDLARRATAAQWAVADPDADEATAAWADVERIEVRLGRDVGRLTRLRRALRRPRPPEPPDGPDSLSVPPAPDEGQEPTAVLEGSRS